MMKKLMIAAAVLAVLAAGAGAIFWYVINMPLYQPGLVRAGTNLSAPLDPPPQGTDPDYWDVEPGIKLYHFAAGTGENVLIIHGGPGNPYPNPWPGQDAPGGKYRYVYYDQRGSGKSTRPIDRFSSSSFYDNMKALDRTLGIGAQLADIERVRRILGDEKLVLVGHSFGGFLASLYAAEFPEHVKALILVAPADVLVMPQPGRDFLAGIGELLPQSMKAEYAEFLKQYLDYANIFSKSEAELVALNAGFARFYVAAVKTQGDTMPAPADDASGGGWMVHAMYFSMGRRHDYRPALKAIAAPVLVIHAANDLQTESVARMYVDAIPGAKQEIIPDAGHFPFIDQSQAFRAMVEGFLETVK